MSETTTTTHDHPRNTRKENVMTLTSDQLHVVNQAIEDKIDKLVRHTNECSDWRRIALNEDDRADATQNLAWAEEDIAHLRAAWNTLNKPEKAS
jgi:hypothetical protein